MLKNIGLALLAAGTIAAGSVAIDTPAQAEAGVSAGVLTCHVSSGFGFIFGSSRELRCVYSTTGEHYVGHISKFGVDIGYTQGGVIIWTVLAPTARLAPGMLGGHYGGATAGATAGVGLDANALIGGNHNTVTLQPLSLEGNQGLNIAAGIAEVTLHPVR
ncbi:MAG TPA: DUF992 domain-containing protein [Stellaceae bacterium]|jgi:hypothetical protein|nr:DUF992 domain-containing protein [Stellaceae bacterium]